MVPIALRPAATTRPSEIGLGEGANGSHGESVPTPVRPASPVPVVDFELHAHCVTVVANSSANADAVPFMLFLCHCVPRNAMGGVAAAPRPFAGPQWGG